VRRSLLRAIGCPFGPAVVRPCEQHRDEVVEGLLRTVPRLRYSGRDGKAFRAAIPTMFGRPTQTRSSSERRSQPQEIQMSKNIRKADPLEAEPTAHVDVSSSLWDSVGQPDYGAARFKGEVHPDRAVSVAAVV
jgi:hypothetical protein